MLKDLYGENPAAVKIQDAAYPEPFRSGLEYNPPARGVWNIVHTGMLIPQSHQIFACAQGCLRGVILTAAEMNAADRMSWIALEERDMFEGTLETDIIDGAAEIIRELPEKPRAILIFLSCMHLFAGCDFETILIGLRELFPDIDFTDCYMAPTMRKTISPDAKMRMQLYSLLKPLPADPRSVSIIGCDRPTDENSELVKIIRGSGLRLRDITLCETYDEYLSMAESAVNITYLPNAKPAGDSLERRLGIKHLYLPVSFDREEIRRNYSLLCKTLGISIPDLSEDERAAEDALRSAHKLIGDTAVAVDFTAVSRPFGFAELLCRHGFRVKYIFADSVSPEDKGAFDSLKKDFPDIEIRSAVNAKMLCATELAPKEKILAVGQKAAYYCATDYFVNIVSGGGFYGFAGICALAGLMEDAYLHPRARREIIRLKGLGCESCL